MNKQIKDYLRELDKTSKCPFCSAIGTCKKVPGTRSTEPPDIYRTMYCQECGCTITELVDVSKVLSK